MQIFKHARKKCKVCKKKNFYLANNILTYLIIPNENKTFDIRSKMKIETTL